MSAEAPYAYLREASYKGVNFIFTSSSILGGKKTVTQGFVNSDFQLIEELGKKQRAYSISGYVALVGEETDYLTKRDKLIEAFESPGHGIFVHPFYGPIENSVVNSFSIRESTDEIGIGDIQIEFGITNVDLGPVQDILTPSILIQNNKQISETSKSLIESKFTVNPKLLGVYTSAKTKLVTVGEKFDSSVKFAVKKTDDITKAITKPTDKLSNEIAGFQRDIVKLASNPIRLAASITNVFATINATMATASAAYEVFAGFFGFGWTDDIELRFDTVANRAKNANNRILNDTMNAMALSNAYLASAQKDYRTVDEIDADVAVMESQLIAIEERPGIDSNLLADLYDARQNALALLAAARLKASSIVLVDIENVSARALSYMYYGDDSRAVEISRLNNGSGIILDSPIKILSK